MKCLRDQRWDRVFLQETRRNCTETGIRNSGEFPGGSVVKTCAFTTVDPGLIPGWEIPQAMQCGKEKFRVHYEK